jgi:hypothetical protein
MSIIQDILDDTIQHSTRGLDYAAYAVRLPQGTGDGGELKVLIDSRNEAQVAFLLRRFGFGGRVPEEQFNLWGKLVPRVDKVLRGLDGEFVRTGQGESVRVVFDIDMGGLYYTRIGSHAVVFGATLDQEEVNNGRCEKQMSRMVAQIEDVCTAHGE